MEPTTRNQPVEDAISYYLQANRGERPMPIKDSSSGGELSRLLFALKSVLAEKNRPQTMIFDEIDANVGGETATTVGEKLKKLGHFRQVICITHFPQVASQGDHHLRVSKDEIGNRTICRIDSLDKKAKEAELLRMLGGETSLSNSPYAKILFID